MSDSVGRTVEWETGGTERCGATVDASGMCWLYVKKTGSSKELFFEMNTATAAEIIGFLARWLAEENAGAEALLREQEALLAQRSPSCKQVLP